MGDIKYDYFTSRSEWLTKRKEGIGGSAAGTILGVSPYETPWGYWARRKGILPPQDENLAMRMGHALEPAVVDLFAQETGATVEERTDTDFTVTNTDYPFAVASPDRLVRLPDGSRAVLECKTTQRRVTAENLPKTWFCQVQLYMAVCDIKQGAVAWLVRGLDFGYLDIPRDDRFCDYMMSRLADFHARYLVGDEEPVPLAQDAPLAFPTSTETSVELSSEAYMAAMRLEELRAEQEGRQSEIDQLTDFLKLQMGEAAVATFKGETVATWRTSKPRRTLDTARLKEAYPGIYEAFLKEGRPSRPFKLSKP